MYLSRILSHDPSLVSAAELQLTQEKYKTLEAMLQCTEADGYIYTLQEYEQQKARFDAMIANYERQLEGKTCCSEPSVSAWFVSPQPVLYGCLVSTS